MIFFKIVVLFLFFILVIVIILWQHLLLNFFFSESLINCYYGIFFSQLKWLIYSVFVNYDGYLEFESEFEITYNIFA